MLYQRINLAKLYEQVTLSDNQPAEVETPNNSQRAEKLKKNALYAFPITNDLLPKLKEFAKNGQGEWKSETPLKTIQAGADSQAAMLNGKPVYLMIKLAQSKEDKNTLPSNIDLQDRVYVVYTTTKEELDKQLDSAKSFMKRVRVSVKTPDSKEQSLELWVEDKNDQNFISKQQNADTAGKTSEQIKAESGQQSQPQEQVKINIEQQMEAPGTPAGIQSI